MAPTLRSKYINRPYRYTDSDWVTEFPRPHNRCSIRYWMWLEKEEENEEPLGWRCPWGSRGKIETITWLNIRFASSDDDTSDDDTSEA